MTTMIDINSLLYKVKQFPTLPTIYTTLLDVMSDSKSTAGDLAKVISKDQASATKILQVANSSIFGLQNRVNTIKQAIVYIGFNEVKNIVIALTIIDMFSFSENTDEYSIDPINLWKHSLAVGILARQIGKTIGVQKFENYFLAGILHDLGKLLLLRLIPEEYISVYKYSIDNKIPLREVEKDRLGITSSVAGDILAEKWKLPLYVINSIKYHNSGIVNGKLDTLISCIHIANITASSYGLAVDPSEMIPKPNSQIWNYINLPKNFFADNESKFFVDYEQMVNLMLKY